MVQAWSLSLNILSAYVPRVVTDRGTAEEIPPPQSPLQHTNIPTDVGLLANYTVCNACLYLYFYLIKINFGDTCFANTYD
jgi:hypothetical protein